MTLTYDVRKDRLLTSCSEVLLKRGFLLRFVNECDDSGVEELDFAIASGFFTYTAFLEIDLENCLNCGRFEASGFGDLISGLRLNLPPLVFFHFLLIPRLFGFATLE